MGFVDTHVHLHFPDYDADRAEVIEKARDAGVRTFINVGTDLKSSRASLDLAKSHDFIYASAGIHPHDAGKASEQELKEIEEILKDPRMVAIGEVGLDYFRGHSPREAQKNILRKFCRMHKIIGKPLILHCRDAYEDLYTLLKEELGGKVAGVMHCFSSEKDTMEKFIELGLHISFAGPLTYKKNDALREACRACPSERLVLETDAPFLPPQSRRGKRNESALLMETAQTAAEARGISLEGLGEMTTENARGLFHL